MESDQNKFSRIGKNHGSARFGICEKVVLNVRVIVFYSKLFYIFDFQKINFKDIILMKTKFLILTFVLALFGIEMQAQCKGKCRDGKGVYTFDKGEVYDGNFANGQFDGQGTYTYNSGAKYAGTFKEGKRNGNGTYTYPTGDTYTGGFVDGLPDGQGTYTFANGDRYEGEFKKGKRNGTGTYFFANGTKLKGVFENSALVEEISIERQVK